MARGLPALGAIVPMLGRNYTYSHAKAHDLLGWTPRPARTTVVECAESLSAQRAA